METKVTLDTILNWLIDAVESKKVISPSMWVNTAQKINILLHGEYDKLFDLQQQVAVLQSQYIELDKSVAESKVLINASEVYKHYKKQESKINLVQEEIRLAKIQARLSDTEFRN